jgi:hypothetical protein
VAADRIDGGDLRAAFGPNGNYPVALLSWLSASGWVAVNSVLAIFARVGLALVAGLGTGTAVKIAGPRALTSPLCLTERASRSSLCGSVQR